MPRIATSVLVTALLRLAEREGGFGTVIFKGDENAGALLILLAERGRRVTVLERLLQPDGSYAWASPLKPDQEEAELDGFVARRRRFDPDSWVLELDTASAERFADEIKRLD